MVYLTFFCNVKLYEAIKAKVADKVDSTRLPKFMKSRVKGVASLTSGKVIKPSEVAKKMSAKMQEKMPQKMASKGLSVEVHEEFCEGIVFLSQTITCALFFGQLIGQKLFFICS